MIRKTMMLISVALCLNAAARGQTLALDWFTIDGGGAMSSAGTTFSVYGTIGQPDVGLVMSGGNFELVGGFWSSRAAERDCGDCVGDIVIDGSVDLSDLALLLSNFGVSTGATCQDGDIVGGDGSVDLSDLALLLANFGRVCD